MYEYSVQGALKKRGEAFSSERYRNSGVQIFLYNQNAGGLRNSWAYQDSEDFEIANTYMRDRKAFPNK